MAQTEQTQFDSVEQSRETYMPAMLQEPDIGRIERFLKKHFYFPDGF